MFLWPETFASKHEFEQARKQFVELYRQCLGEMPERIELKPKVLATEQRDGYRRELVEYAVEKDEPAVRAFVCIPDKIDLPTGGVVAAGGLGAASQVEGHAQDKQYEGKKDDDSHVTCRLLAFPGVAGHVPVRGRLRRRPGPG